MAPKSIVSPQLLTTSLILESGCGETAVAHDVKAMDGAVAVTANGMNLDQPSNLSRIVVL